VIAPVASVVIPAHDEAPRIEATLRVLLDGAEPGEFEVVVVCNGCSDRTAEIAEQVPGVTVREIAVPSKVTALEVGDHTTAVYPRIYLDADTHLTAEGARALVAELERPGIHVAGMRADLVAPEASRSARWFLEFRATLPVFSGGIIGAGVYALDEAGRARFGAWPNVLGDDQFILRSFASHERGFVATHRTRSPGPTDLSTVVRRGVRVRRGNAELGEDLRLPPPRSGAPVALRAAAKDVRRWPGAVVWAAVAVITRVLAQGRWGDGDWVAGTRRRRGRS
jgi:glycosyltransferase involved in cell wall biosynthesis